MAGYNSHDGYLLQFGVMSSNSDKLVDMTTKPTYHKIIMIF
jgi:hypothetical protein